MSNITEFVLLVENQTRNVFVFDSVLLMQEFVVPYVDRHHSLIIFLFIVNTQAVFFV